MEERNKKYQIVKLAMVIAAVFLILLYALMTFFVDRSSYEDLEEILDVLANTDLSETYSVNYNDDVSWTHRPSLDIVERNNFFEDPRNVLKYLISFAILSDEENFFFQFDPSVRINDFPDVTTMKEEQQQLFNLFTRDNKLDKFKILSLKGQAYEERYRAKIELSYNDGVMKRVIILLGKAGDEHSHYLQWYIISSIHDIISQF